MTMVRSMARSEEGATNAGGGRDDKQLRHATGGRCRRFAARPVVARMVSQCNITRHEAMEEGSRYRKVVIYEVVAKLVSRVVLDHQLFEIVSTLVGGDGLTRGSRSDLAPVGTRV